ncbi:MAG: hypothetical protein MUF69_10395, partial [Desulfobacterota bacterium]|nr:hypothetical protein [Thermodesulfobacteriota bacterium]
KVIEEAMQIPEHLKDKVTKDDILQLYQKSGTKETTLTDSGFFYRLIASMPAGNPLRTGFI